MTKSLITALCCILVLASSSCGKKGCMDNTANNYDPEATQDNGSCTYDPANQYVGTYIATDTFIHLTGVNSNGTNPTFETVYSQPGLIVTKKDANTLTIRNFGPCLDTITTTVSTNSLIIANQFSNCFLTSGLGGKVISVNGNKLRYFIPYVNGSPSSYLDTLKGVAIKQ